MNSKKYNSSLLDQQPPKIVNIFSLARYKKDRPAEGNSLVQTSVSSSNLQHSHVLPTGISAPVWSKPIIKPVVNGTPSRILSSADLRVTLSKPSTVSQHRPVTGAVLLSTHSSSNAYTSTVGSVPIRTAPAAGVIVPVLFPSPYNVQGHPTSRPVPIAPKPVLSNPSLVMFPVACKPMVPTPLPSTGICIPPSSVQSSAASSGTVSTGIVVSAVLTSVNVVSHPQNSPPTLVTPSAGIPDARKSFLSPVLPPVLSTSKEVVSTDSELELTKKSRSPVKLQALSSSSQGTNEIRALQDLLSKSIVSSGSAAVKFPVSVHLSSHVRPSTGSSTAVQTSSVSSASFLKPVLAPIKIESFLSPTVKRTKTDESVFVSSSVQTTASSFLSGPSSCNSERVALNITPSQARSTLSDSSTSALPMVSLCNIGCLPDLAKQKCSSNIGPTVLQPSESESTKDDLLDLQNVVDTCSTVKQDVIMKADSSTKSSLSSIDSDNIEESEAMAIAASLFIDEKSEQSSIDSVLPPASTTMSTDVPPLVVPSDVAMDELSNDDTMQNGVSGHPGTVILSSDSGSGKDEDRDSQETESVTEQSEYEVSSSDEDDGAMEETADDPEYVPSESSADDDHSSDEDFVPYRRTRSKRYPRRRQPKSKSSSSNTSAKVSSSPSSAFTSGTTITGTSGTPSSTSTKVASNQIDPKPSSEMISLILNQNDDIARLVRAAVTTHLVKPVASGGVNRNIVPKSPSTTASISSPRINKIELLKAQLKKHDEAIQKLRQSINVSTTVQCTQSAVVSSFSVCQSVSTSSLSSIYTNVSSGNVPSVSCIPVLPSPSSVLIPAGQITKLGLSGPLLSNLPTAAKVLPTLQNPSLSGTLTTSLSVAGPGPSVVIDSSKISALKPTTSSMSCGSRGGTVLNISAPSMTTVSSSRSDSFLKIHTSSAPSSILPSLSVLYSNTTAVSSTSLSSSSTLPRILPTGTKSDSTKRQAFVLVPTSTGKQRYKLELPTHVANNLHKYDISIESNRLKLKPKKASEATRSKQAHAVTCVSVSRPANNVSNTTLPKLAPIVGSHVPASVVQIIPNALDQQYETETRALNTSTASIDRPSVTCNVTVNAAAMTALSGANTPMAYVPASACPAPLTLPSLVSQGSRPTLQFVLPAGSSSIVRPLNTIPGQSVSPHPRFITIPVSAAASIRSPTVPVSAFQPRQQLFQIVVPTSTNVANKVPYVGTLQQSVGKQILLPNASVVPSSQQQTYQLLVPSLISSNTSLPVEQKNRPTLSPPQQIMQVILPTSASTADVIPTQSSRILSQQQVVQMLLRNNTNKMSGAVLLNQSSVGSVNQSAPSSRTTTTNTYLVHRVLTTSSSTPNSSSVNSSVNRVTSVQDNNSVNVSSQPRLVQPATPIVIQTPRAFTADSQKIGSVGALSSMPLPPQLISLHRQHPSSQPPMNPILSPTATLNRTGSSDQKPLYILPQTSAVGYRRPRRIASKLEIPSHVSMTDALKVVRNTASLSLPQPENVVPSSLLSYMQQVEPSQQAMPNCYSVSSTQPVLVSSASLSHSQSNVSRDTVVRSQAASSGSQSVSVCLSSLSKSASIATTSSVSRSSKTVGSSSGNALGQCLSVPVVLGRYEKLFSMANLKRPKWNFLPQSTGLLFPAALGMEICAEYLLSDYFHDSKGRVNLTEDSNQSKLLGKRHGGQSSCPAVAKGPKLTNGIVEDKNKIDPTAESIVGLASGKLDLTSCETDDVIAGESMFVSDCENDTLFHSPLDLTSIDFIGDECVDQLYIYEPKTKKSAKRKAQGIKRKAGVELNSVSQSSTFEAQVKTPRLDSLACSNRLNSTSCKPVLGDASVDGQEACEALADTRIGEGQHDYAIARNHAESVFASKNSDVQRGQSSETSTAHADTRARDRLDTETVTDSGRANPIMDESPSGLDFKTNRESGKCNSLNDHLATGACEPRDVKTTNERVPDIVPVNIKTLNLQCSEAKGDSVPSNIRADQYPETGEVKVDVKLLNLPSSETVVVSENVDTCKERYDTMDHQHLDHVSDSVTINSELSSSEIGGACLKVPISTISANSSSVIGSVVKESSSNNVDDFSYAGESRDDHSYSTIIADQHHEPNCESQGNEKLEIEVKGIAATSLHTGSDNAIDTVSSICGIVDSSEQQNMTSNAPEYSDNDKNLDAIDKVVDQNLEQKTDVITSNGHCVLEHIPSSSCTSIPCSDSCSPVLATSPDHPSAPNGCPDVIDSTTEDSAETANESNSCSGIPVLASCSTLNSEHAFSSIETEPTITQPSLSALDYTRSKTVRDSLAFSCSVYVTDVIKCSPYASGKYSSADVMRKEIMMPTADASRHLLRENVVFSETPTSESMSTSASSDLDGNAGDCLGNVSSSSCMDSSTASDSSSICIDPAAKEEAN